MYAQQLLIQYSSRESCVTIIIIVICLYYIGAETYFSEYAGFWRQTKFYIFAFRWVGNKSEREIWIANELLLSRQGRRRSPAIYSPGNSCQKIPYTSVKPIGSRDPVWIFVWAQWAYNTRARGTPIASQNIENCFQGLILFFYLLRNSFGLLVLPRGKKKQSHRVLRLSRVYSGRPNTTVIIQ